MELKKNPNLDPGRNSRLYFSLSAFSLAVLTFFVLELKTLESELTVYKPEIDLAFSDVDIPITKVKERLPETKPQTVFTDVVQVVIDDTALQDDEPTPAETSTESEPIVSAAQIKIEEPPVDDDIPFFAIEEVPVFPGCEKVAKDKRKSCLQEKIQQHIRKHFTYPESAISAGIQGKVNVGFIIDKQGMVQVAFLRGPDKTLEKEAERIISKLPQMQPGKQNNKPVRMSMSIPIVFSLKN